MKRHFRELSVALALGVLLLFPRRRSAEILPTATAPVAAHARSTDARYRVRHGARHHLPAD
jgi:hypothetical protein